MQVRDERAWAEQASELEADEESAKFAEFLQFWVETAEKMLEEEFPLTERNPVLPIHAYVSKALEVAEQTFGYLSVEWIAQMLLVITQHWVRGEQLLESLTFIEKRLVEQATALKLVELQAGASITTEE